ncbi:MAG: methyltransferase regulatory domain-containing protein [Gemmataceae bacterium]
MFQLCQQCLSPHGVAYVSYNTLPGGHLRRMIRDMLLLHCSPAQAPEAKLSRARDLLHFLVHGISADDTQAQAVRAEAERTAHHVDALLFHDDLAEVNQPVYFHDFVAQARRYGLDYLVETDFNEGQELELPTEVAEQLAGLDRILHAQYLDFLKCRRFRQTLLCRQEAPRGVPVQAAVHKLWIGSDARATGEQVDLAADVEMEFLATTGSNMQSRDPAVKAAMTALEAEWPRYQTFPALVARAYEMLIDSGGAAVVEEELARVLLQGFATGLIELSVRPPYWDGLEARPESPLPCTSTLVRWQLSRGEPAVTTFLLRNIIIEDEETRQVLAACDGQNQPEEAATPQITRLARLSLLYPLPTA